jgi:hypothetical protein
VPPRSEGASRLINHTDIACAQLRHNLRRDQIGKRVERPEQRRWFGGVHLRTSFDW